MPRVNLRSTAPYILAVNLVILDLVFVWMNFFSPRPAAKSPDLPTVVRPAVNPTISDTCGPACQSYIDNRINTLLHASPSGATVPITKPLPSVGNLASSPHPKTRTVSVFSIPGTGSTLANDWADIPGTDFYFDQHDYPGLIEAHLTVNLRLVNGNGRASIRLFDVTHGIGVNGSEVSTGSQVDELVTSDKLIFWQGNNLYRIQAKSLTADTTVYTSGILKITSEN
jgi:hypothetical protein